MVAWLEPPAHWTIRSTQRRESVASLRLELPARREGMEWFRGR
jgi:hypothetical protein